MKEMFHFSLQLCLLAKHSALR